MRSALRVGAAIYNEGHYHPAHDAWEDRWLELSSGTDDERLLHGLIQFTAAVHHARRRNWTGAQGLAERATGYLSGLPPAHRGVALEAVLAELEAIATDPAVLERRRPAPLRIDGTAPRAETLSAAELARAAAVLAADTDLPAAPVRSAGQLVVETAEPGGPIGRLLRELLARGADRAVVVDRLRTHVDRHRARGEAVDDLLEDPGASEHGGE